MSASLESFPSVGSLKSFTGFMDCRNLRTRKRIPIRRSCKRLRLPVLSFSIFDELVIRFLGRRNCMIQPHGDADDMVVRTIDDDPRPETWSKVLKEQAVNFPLKISREIDALMEWHRE